jgi:hypothetical protein
MFYHRFIVLLTVTFAGMACASGGGSGDTDSQAPGVSRSRNLITRAEIEAINESTAYDVVEQLHPDWFTSRVTLRTGPILPILYVDNMRRGQVAELRSIPIDDVEEIRYINARDATTRWGTGVSGGVIEVTTRRR